MYVFLYRTRKTPAKYYYIVSADLTEVMSTCKHIPYLAYMGRVSLDKVGAGIDSIPIPPERGKGYYDPISEFEDDQFRTALCNRCSTPICGKQKGKKERTLQDTYSGRKLSRYPGKSGEENEE